ncbi:hypothetical protein GCM10009737_14690 [Nocardioides lentus]|uniref:Fibronectin type-III domain-containing protein n=1 Tax=Nocardioides lentus TaxID=338077 RepID=A0ABP5AJK4_9ACTN
MHPQHPPATGRLARASALLGLVAASLTVVLTGPATSPATAAAAPGQGFTVTAGDLSFILKQIRIAERHAATRTASNPCGTLVGSAPNQVPDRLAGLGLRTVDGTCNNLFGGREGFGAAHRAFPRVTPARFRDAQGAPPGFPAQAGSSYTQKKGFVYDAEPRLVSNLVVDQTSSNPAAVSAAGFPVRTQGNPGAFPCTTDPDPLAPDPVVGVPAGCVPSNQTLPIPNVTTDVGLSPPFNSVFTFFGQFFDHGVDQTVKGGGTVVVPLAADDPLRTVGPDRKPGTGDEVPASRAFMVLDRALNQPGPDGVVGDDLTTEADESADDVTDAENTDSPWVDQSQTYTSHPSHQVFLREYRLDGDHPVATGRLLGGLGSGETYPGSPDGRSGLATWASTKKQAAEVLGLRLSDADATDVPLLATDPYGQFVPGPNGLPQYVRADGSLVEGDLADPVAPPTDVERFHVPFLTDIAHHADPSPRDVDRDPSTPAVAPTPDPDDTPSSTGSGQPAGTYDDEMLDAHFAAGDGRVNENIALSAVHQVFHSEHDRLVADIERTLAQSGNAALSTAFHAVDPTASDPSQRTFTYGDRLFQAARFVNEMEYQHLVFEEFGRKVQPAIHPFRVYTPDVDPATVAEFAHAVYRFGHSMLDDDVARRNADGSDSSLPLLTAFLNPIAYQEGGSAGILTPEEAAGSIFLGSSDQVGNEIDEFVTETLRNNLVGLPLDLATLNIARARDAGVPSLNQFRRTVHAETGDSQLTPYGSWAELGQALRHPETLVNLVAAYGRHPSILAASSVSGRRTAAKALVDPTAEPTTDPTAVPADAAAFLFGTDGRDLVGCDAPDAGCRDWSDVGGRPSTGLDDVDLWVGGLAENTNVFGGLLGSTFNHVFQTQMELLQDADRFYYLHRTPGLNLRAQLEGNSFAELIQRNTEGTTALKSDVFATADCRFALGNLAGTPAGYASSGASVTDDPGSQCDENALLLRRPDGTLQYRSTNAVDPPGINGQAVYQGTPGVDRVYGGNDNDTVWGDDGADRVDGGGGDDVALGGDGDDVITDVGGADVPKGGPGDDAVEAGPGDDIVMGGDGQDLLSGGTNDNEEFGGNGDDLIMAGTGGDVAFGDAGDDWIQGGTGQDLLIGDHGAPFFDDPGEPTPGHDVFLGQAGENDYDAEGGDDVMAQNAAVDRNAGAGGFDWAIHQYDTVGADDDMSVNNFLDGLPQPVVVNRDRWQEVEGDSGSAFDDTIRGTEDVHREVGGGGFTGCNALDRAGVDRIAGLDPLLPPLTQDLAPVVAGSAAGACPLSGPVWGEGDILLGGAGSDLIEGRGGDDVIDGDRHLQVRLSVRTDPADPATEIGTTDRIEGRALSGGFGPQTSGETLQKAIMDGDVDPGRVVSVREISTTPHGSETDTAVYPGPRAQYTVTVGADGSTVTVADTGPGVGTGTDTLRGMERLRFADQTVLIAPPAAPVLGATTPGPERVAVAFTGVDPATSVLDLEVLAADGSVLRTVRRVPLTATSVRVTALTAGVPVSFRMVARSAFGTSSTSNTVGPVLPLAPLPAAPSITSVTAGDRLATLRLAAGASRPDAAPTTEYRVRVYVGGVYQRTALGYTDLGSDVVVRSLVNGTAYTFQAYAVSGSGTSPFSAMTGPVTPADTTPPTVTATSPVDGTVGVSRGASPRVTFSEAVDGVSPTSVRLVTAAGVETPTTLTLSANRRSLLVDPVPPLLPTTQYRLVLTGGGDAIHDAAGNPLTDRTVVLTTR